MSVLIKVTRQDEAPEPWEHWSSLSLADMAAREHVLGHPYFPVDLRAKYPGTAKGYAREWCYPGDYQLRIRGRSWPRMWAESGDLIGVVHELCFDAQGPRLKESMESIRDKLARKLAYWTDEPLPSAEHVADRSQRLYDRMPFEAWR